MPCATAAWFYRRVRGTFSAFRQWRWLVVILWMAVIFSASSGAMSSANTSRFIGPVVRWLIPSISNAALGRVVFTVRKAAHVTEYAILAVLWLWAWRKGGSARTERQNEQASQPVASAPGPAEHTAASAWRWSEAFIALGAAALYAASDEIHQFFVPTREARIGDVLLDSSGAMLGLLGLWLVGRWRNWW